MRHQKPAKNNFPNQFIPKITNQLDLRSTDWCLIWRGKPCIVPYGVKNLQNDNLETLELPMKNVKNTLTGKHACEILWKFCPWRKLTLPEKKLANRDVIFYLWKVLRFTGCVFFRKEIPIVPKKQDNSSRRVEKEQDL